ncbi:MAG: DUF2795 domain-containing protein [Xenococcaceae cyanobacterium]
MLIVNDRLRILIMAAANPVGVQQYLKGMDYPATKDDLIDYAEEKGAEDEILDLLEQLPEDEEYNTPIELNKALGKIQ